MPISQNAEQNRTLLTANKYLENVATTATNQNCAHEEIGSRLNSRNVC